MEEEFLEYFIWVVCESIASLQFPLLEQSFLKLKITISVIEGSLD